MSEDISKLKKYNIKKFRYLRSIVKIYLTIYTFVRANIFSFFLEERSHEKNVDVVFIVLAEIGDFIIWLDQAKKLKEIYKDKKILLVCNVLVSEIAEKTNYFDEIVSIDKKLFSTIEYRKNIIRKLREIECEDLISSAYTRNFFFTDFVVKNIKAKNKIGYNSESINNPKILLKYGNRWYTKLIIGEKKEIMELVRNAEFIRKVYDIKFMSSLPKIEFELPQVEVGSKKDKIVFFLATSNIGRTWAVENYVKLAEIVPEKYDIILCGTKQEEKHSESFKKIYNGKSNVHNICGKTTLLETLSIIKNSKLVIGNDSSCIHMAVALRTKSLCVLCGGHFGRFIPYNVEILAEEEKKILPEIIYKKMECFNCNHFCKYKLEKNRSYRCMEEIDIEEARLKLKNIIGELDGFFSTKKK
ncbi:MAG: glycosyltransferase family 9 protein [Fusobacteriaceae bacterium]